MHSLKIHFRLHDLLFYMLLVFSFYYTRNMMCRLMMVVFFGYTFLQMIVKKRKVLLPFYYFGFLLFILYGAAKVWLGDVINSSIPRTMTISLLLNLLMIVSIVQYIYMTNDVSRVLRVTELGIFTTAFVVVLLSVGTITQGRLGGGTEINSNMLAILCVYGFVLSMYLRKTGKIGQAANWLRMFFYLLVILLTGSRKGLIMILLAVVIIQFIFEKNNILRLARNALIGVAAVAVIYVIIMNVDMLYSIVGVRVEALLDYLSEGSTTEASLADREKLPALGMEYFKQKPWTGYGYDCFKLVSGKGPNGKVAVGEVGFYSHNNYVELLFGGGIIGFVLYYIPVAYLLVKLIKRIHKDVCIPYLLAMLISLLSVEYARVTYYARIDAYITGVLLGCAIIVGREQSEQPFTNIKEIAE